MRNQVLFVSLLVAFVNGSATPVGTETTKPALQPRGLIGFAQFVWYYTGRNPLDYNNYGCWCGVGKKGTKTVDAIDECCKAHDACYENIGYLGVGSICLADGNSEAYKACMCDKIAAQCFAANEYNPYWKDKCQ